MRYLKLSLGRYCTIWAGVVLLFWPFYAYTRTFEFLYINASEGSASGGHAAIRFDNEVFHFQHVDPGLLRIFRDDFPAFRFSYGYQENRTIRGHRIEVDETVFQKLRDAFNRRLLIQNQQFELLTALDEDRKLLNNLKRVTVTESERLPPTTIDLKALGYFTNYFRPNADSNPFQSDLLPRSTALEQLKRSVIADYGDGFLAAKRQQIWKQLLALKPELANSELSIAEDRFAPGDYSFSQRYRNQLLNLAALDVLEAVIAPRPESLLTANISKLRLSDNSIQQLARFKQTLFTDLIKLMRSERNDWGYPFLVGMARLHALEISIKSRQLVVLNRFHSNDTGVKSVSVTSDNMTAIMRFADEAFTTAITHLAKPEELNERSYAELEARAGTLVQIDSHSQSKQSFRVPALDHTPSLPAPAELVQLPISTAALAYYHSIITTQSEDYSDKLQTQYPYQLLRSNCVTEIFRVLNQTVAGQSNKSDSFVEPEASKLALGGFIDNEMLNIIPFVAFDQVADHYRLDSSYRLPPYREQRIEQQHQSETNILVDLTESNTLTSSLYQWHGKDAAFLFFTQDSIWSRPLFGSLNLVFAAGQALYGALILPWDWGENLQKSLKGMIVSVPELFFFNIRKGSFPQLIPLSTPNED